MKRCIIINDCVPLEPFLKNELRTQKSFDNIFVISLHDLSLSSDDLETSEKIVSIEALPHKIRLLSIFFAVLKFGFDINVYRELKFLFIKNKLNIRTFYTMLRFYIGAESKYYQIKKLIKSFKICDCDEKIVYSYWMHQHAYIAVKLARYINAKCITRCHGYDFYEYRSGCNYIPFRDYIFKYVDKIFPISQNGVRYLTENYGKRVAGKVQLSYLGTFDHGINCRKTDSYMRIVSCSNIIPLKRLDMLIHSLSKIDFEIEWIHFGDGESMSEIKLLAEKKLRKNISWFFYGKTNNNDIMTFYQNNFVDLFINVSSFEGLPVSIMEAMSFGIPVIATDVGGTSEIVSDEENGFLLEANFDFDDLADRIRRFSNLDNAAINVLRQNARKTWEKKFNAVKNYRLFYDIIFNNT